MLGHGREGVGETYEFGKGPVPPRGVDKLQVHSGPFALVFKELGIDLPEFDNKLAKGCKGWACRCQYELQRLAFRSKQIDASRIV